uniref:M-phase inducer phosphatase n=1 Tax=Caenorhabditis japonica TaxID=281687 RepID=A0A8R1DME3_CAEJA
MASSTMVEALDFSKIGDTTNSARQALTDCSNFVAKVVMHSSGSAFFHCDTPTGRQPKSVFYSDSLDLSQYEKERLESRKRSSASLSPSCSLMDRKRSRNMSLVAPQSDKICRYSTTSLEKAVDPFKEDDDVFVADDATSFTYIPSEVPRSTTSLWELGGSLERKTSDTSGNGGSFLEKEVKYTLPSVEFPQKASQAYRSISAITLLSEFHRLGDAFHSIYVIVDCRYPYEFRGGHVRGAINMYKRGEINAMFFPDDVDLMVTNKRIPIFYCEYSQKRGPTMANAVRSIDRVRNELRYPHVEYPEMYLLDHGYKALWNRRECRQICDPCDYVPMDHKHFTNQMKTARGERHRSQASVQKNGEPAVEQNKWSMRTRSAVRRDSSVMSLHSRFSHSSSSLSNWSSQLFTGYREEALYLENEKPKKSVSAFNINSVGSEDDIDTALARRKLSTLSAATSIPITTPLEAEQHVVQLGLKIITPDFPCRPSEATPSLPQYPALGLHDEKSSTPRAFLDFSQLSDTE